MKENDPNNVKAIRQKQQGALSEQPRGLMCELLLFLCTYLFISLPASKAESCCHTGMTGNRHWTLFNWVMSCFGFFFLIHRTCPIDPMQITWCKWPLDTSTNKTISEWNRFHNWRETNWAMRRRGIRTMALPVCVCANMVCQLVPAMSLLFTEARIHWKASPTVLIYQLDKYVPVPLQALSHIRTSALQCSDVRLEKTNKAWNVLPGL